MISGKVVAARCLLLLKANPDQRDEGSIGVIWSFCVGETDDVHMKVLQRSKCCGVLGATMTEERKLQLKSTTQRQPLVIVDVPLILGQETVLLLIEQKPWWLCILSESEWMLKFVSPSTSHGMIHNIQNPEPADVLLFKGTI